MEAPRVRTGVTQPRDDRRFSVLERILAKRNGPLAAFLRGIVDD